MANVIEQGGADTAVMGFEPPGGRTLAVPPRPGPVAPLQDLRPPSRWPRRVLAALALLVGCLGAGAWWLHRPSGLPPGFAASNGRLEADEIDISTKFPGRVALLRADEGDMVAAGQVLARMDTSDLQASLRQAEAMGVQAQHTAEAARAEVEQGRSVFILAGQELQRATWLVGKGFETQQVLDQRRSQMNVAIASYNSARQKLDAALAAQEATQQTSALVKVNIADNTLVAPKDGRIEYRLANVGVVLPAGGKLFTMLDTSYVYMDVFLPTAEAGQVQLGADARIVLDAYPRLALPAAVTFLAAQSQFTPKTVETKSERDKLMFRVRVRVAPELLQAHAQQVRSGMPGVTTIRLDKQADWPAAMPPVAQ